MSSEQLLMEQLDYNLLFRWFVGLGIDDRVWVPETFSVNRDRLMEGDVAQAFFDQVLHDEPGSALGRSLYGGWRSAGSLGEPEELPVDG
jgi:hypothetical protein